MATVTETEEVSPYLYVHQSPLAHSSPTVNFIRNTQDSSWHQSEDIHIDPYHRPHEHRLSVARGAESICSGTVRCLQQRRVLLHQRARSVGGAGRSDVRLYKDFLFYFIFSFSDEVKMGAHLQKNLGLK